MTCPAAGSPVAEYAPVGAVTAVTVSSPVPVLEMIAVSDFVVPVGTSPKASVPGVDASPGLVPTACRSSSTGPRLVLTVSVAVAAPVAAGVNVTGRSSDCPAASVRGSPAALTPNGAVVDAADTVTGADAVRC